LKENCQLEMRPFACSIALLILSFASSCASPQPQAGGAIGSNQTRAANCVNLNTATAEQLKALPEIGEVLARRIIEYRERHGNFRRPQEIIIIEGFSEKRYRTIAELICVE
jgi:competence protein ComEA